MAASDPDFPPPPPAPGRLSAPERAGAVATPDFGLDRARHVPDRPRPVAHPDPDLATAEPPEWILGITREIWEHRAISTLKRHYADDIPVRSPASVVVGNVGVIPATMATLAEFPDRELLGEDVIWHGDRDGGFFSSHRLMCHATHSRPGMYGAPTNRKLRYRILADCAVQGGQVYDEWLVRDQSAIVRQMGLDAKSWAADLITREGGPERCVRPLTPANDVAPRYTALGNAHPVGERYADMLTRLMDAEFDLIPREYDRACHLELPGGVTANGWTEADEFWMGLRASLPDATFTVHHSMGRDDPWMSPRAAVRWTLHGTHSGWGMFGTPTGAEIYVLGISHAEYGRWGLRQEYVLFDETAIWKQILLQSG